MVRGRAGETTRELLLHAEQAERLVGLAHRVGVLAFLVERRRAIELGHGVLHVGVALAHRRGGVATLLDEDGTHRGGRRRRHERQRQDGGAPQRESHGDTSLRGWGSGVMRPIVGRVTPKPVPRYFFTPRSAAASLASLSESACLPPSWSFCASSSLATAAFTFGSSAFIFAAASRVSLITFGHELANAALAVKASATATAVTAMSFLMCCHPPPEPVGSRQCNSLSWIGVPLAWGGSGRRSAARASGSPSAPPPARPPRSREPAAPSRASSARPSGARARRPGPVAR